MLVENIRLLGRDNRPPYSWLPRQHEHHDLLGTPCPQVQRMMQKRSNGIAVHIMGLCHGWGTPSIGNSSFLKGLLINLTNFCLRGRHYLSYIGQETNLSSVPEEDTISSFQGCLLFKHSWQDSLGKNCQCLCSENLQEHEEPMKSWPQWYVQKTHIFIVIAFR